MGHRLENKKYEFFVFIVIVVILVLIVYEFYGFNIFLIGIEDKDGAALLVVVTIVGIILVLLQRAGIIFADKQFY